MEEEEEEMEVGEMRGQLPCYNLKIMKVSLTDISDMFIALVILFVRMTCHFFPTFFFYYNSLGIH
jgi:hypothetical protein